MRWNPFRRPTPTGRHARVVYPSVPGAAATLVALAATATATEDARAWSDGSTQERVTVPEPMPEDGAAPTPDPAPWYATGPMATVQDPAPALRFPRAGDAAPPAEAVAGMPTTPSAPAWTVGLGFADGAAVELAPDDPRAAVLRAAAAELMVVETR